MSIDWSEAPIEAKWYQPATGLSNAAWLYKEGGVYYACLQGSDHWFEEAYQEECKEWQWIERPGVQYDIIRTN